jgi:hypothetical protein
MAVSILNTVLQTFKRGDALGHIYFKFQSEVNPDASYKPIYDAYWSIVTSNKYNNFTDLVNAMNHLTGDSYPTDPKYQETYDFYIKYIKNLYDETSNKPIEGIINLIKTKKLSLSALQNLPTTTDSPLAKVAKEYFKALNDEPVAPEFGVGVTAFNKENLILRYPDDIPLTSKESDWVRFTFYEYSPPYNGKNTNQQNNTSVTPASTSYTSISNLSTPENLINFRFTTENRPGVYPAKLNGGNTTFKRTGNNYPSIALYMPSGGQITANYSSSWAGKSVSPLMSASLSTVGGVLETISQIEQGNAATLIEKVKQFKSGVLDNRLGLLGVTGASEIARVLNEVSKDFGLGGGDISGNDILSSTTGTILNPNIEVLYQGPTLREFGLSFKMSARNSKESATIRQICDTFKQASLPSTMTPVNNLRDYKNVPAFQKNLLSIPKIVEVTFMTGSSINKNVSQYKICAITHVNINYSPNGVWSTYSDGSPIGVDLSLSFKELKILYEGEYPYILDETKETGMY